MRSPLALDRLPDFPACFDIHEAVAYSRLSPSELARHSREGRLTWKPVGVNGRKLVRKQELDELLAFIWSDRAGSPLEDMDFGEDDD